MEKIKKGRKKRGIKYDFRETCFGIVYKDNKFYVTAKKGEISLIGGGVEENETHQETLKREFIEEAGLNIIDIEEFITIDCYWVTKNQTDMNSLANFYIVSVSDKITKPTEEVSELVILDENEIKKQLVLPYQKEAINIFFETYIKNNNL